MIDFNKKRCNICLSHKDKSDFNKTDGNRCKECKKEYNKNLRAKRKKALENSWF
tara:strand:+ start:130 stop:291 length:162 start_codon:yes stop_codon:yes gene_type:complete